MPSHCTGGGAAALLIVVSVALSGCGSDSPSANPAPSSVQPAPSNPQTSAAAPTKAAAASNPTIADYIRQGGITQSPVRRGDPGTPAVDLPIPEGWVDAGPKTPAGAYSAIVFADPTMATEPPQIVTIMSKLTGNVDPAMIFKYAPGELRNLPGYESAGDGGTAKLAGFDAYQIGATYVKDGSKRLIAQKTVVIPAKEGNGVYVLQLNAGGTEDQIRPLMEATSTIDQRTTITP